MGEKKEKKLTTSAFDFRDVRDIYDLTHSKLHYTFGKSGFKALEAYVQ